MMVLVLFDIITGLALWLRHAVSFNYKSLNQFGTNCIPNLLAQQF